MKIQLILLQLLLLILSTTIFGQWVEKNSGLSDDWITAFAIDASGNAGVVISINPIPPNNHIIYKYDEINETWDELTGPFNDNLEDASDISIIDEDNIWLVTDDVRIYNTKDGGLNWNVQYHGPQETAFLNYIEMFDLDNGIAMGDALNLGAGPAVFLKTTDGGDTWNSVNTTAFGGWSGDMWRRLDFVAPEIGYFYESGVNPQKLYKTVDGGYNWEETNFAGGLQIIKFYDQNIGIACGITIINNDFDNPISTIYRTMDGGENWDSFETSIEGWSNDFEFLPGNPNFVWFTTLSGLYYSENMGETWTEHNLIDGELSGRDIVFIDDNHGWLLCDNGRVYYTDNNGGIVTDVEDNMYSNIPSSFQLNQNYPNPFNPTTTIKYSLPAVGTRHVVSTVLKICDILGNEVTTLVNEYKSPGTYEVKFNGSNLSSGVYFYTLRADKFSDTKKLVLMK